MILWFDSCYGCGLLVLYMFLCRYSTLQDLELSFVMIVCARAGLEAA